MDRRNRNNVTDSDEQEAVMVRYLLGQSPEDERAQVEERYFSDGEYFDRLLALEDSLIDDFVTGRMRAEHLGAFQKSLSGRQDDVRFSRALCQAATKKKLDPTAPEPSSRLSSPRRRMFAQTSSLRLGASIAALVAITFGLALFWNYRALKNRFSEAEAQLVRLEGQMEAAERDLAQARSQRELSAREVEIERNKRIDAESALQKQGRPDSPNILSDFRTIVLGSALAPRGATGSIREVRMPENVRWLRLVVAPEKTDGGFQSFRVAMKRAGEKDLFESESLKLSHGSRKLAVTVPAANLRPGDYIVTVYGERPGAQPTELEQHSFRITE